MTAVRLPGRATPQGTAAFARRATGAAPGHFRAFGALTLSSIGVGTYLGADDEAVDRGYEASLRRAFGLGLNVVDSAINYRNMRSERAVGRALAAAIRAGELAREEVFVATKGGFVPFDGEPPADARGYVDRTYVQPGLIRREELAGGCHCLAPAFLEDQLERSRTNLGLETIDLYALHNPEMQFTGLPRDEAMRRITAAFGFLERAAASGAIAAYGVATWDGLRAEPDERNFLPLTALAGIAETVAGDGHHFRAVQLPYNLAMSEAFALGNQPVKAGRVTALEAARALDLYVFTSASILQGRLTRDLPEGLKAAFPGGLGDAQVALQFVRSTPGVGTALVGMKTVEHVEQNATLAGIPPAAPPAIRALFTDQPEEEGPDRPR